MKKLKKFIWITILLIIVFFICYETFHFIKNKGNVILYVSNQSFLIDTVDIKIRVNGDEVVNDIFVAGNFHNYKKYSLKLTPCVPQSIEIYSENGHAKTGIFMKFFFVNWILIDLWSEEDDLKVDFSNGEIEYIEKKKENPMHWFTIDRSLHPIAFM